jgi:pectin methylesterase-like acyl-CoA thioesterase
VFRRDTLGRSRRRRALAALVAVSAMVVGVSGVAGRSAEAAGAAPTAGSTYSLAVTTSGLCIDVVGGSTANGALLQQWGCSGAAWQQFTVVARTGGYNLVNANSGRCVDVPGSSTSSGVQLQQWGCGDGTKTNQLWTFVASGSGTYQIVSAVSGLCLSDKDASTASGGAVIQETCSANTNKQWSFTGTSSSGTPTVAADGSGRYPTVQAAVDAVPTGNASRVTITIKAGTYREIVTIPSNKPFITLQGLGSSAAGTVIVNNHSSAAGFGTSGSATVFVNGHDFTATNLTISNDFGEGSQAVAANVNADRVIFANVRFLGNQDTLLVNSSLREYFVNSYVEGTVDFIFGGATAVFNACSIFEKRATGGPITAANTDAAKTYGLLFYRSTITGAASNTTQLGRPWGAAAQVLYRETSLSSTIATAQPWVNFGANVWQNARYSEYRNTGSGATTNANRPQLSDATAANYTPQKYLAGSDGWNPVG